MIHAVSIGAPGNAAAALTITQLGFGGAPLGGLFSEVSDAQAHDALDAAWEAGIRHFDTAPLYGYGLSERRFGAFLRTKPRNAFVLSTKVGRLLEPTRGAGPTGGSLGAFVGALPNDAYFDFSAEAVRRSLDDSLTRLGLDRIDIAYIHDPDDDFARAADGAYPALHALREQGVIGAIGVGMNQWEMLGRFVETCELDVVLLAGRYTLLDRTAAGSFLPRCLERNVAVIAGGVFNSGILASGNSPDDKTFNYAQAPPAIVTQVRALARVCTAHGVSLSAAALQFPLRHPAVAGVLAGMRDADEVRSNVAGFAELIPAQLWKDIDAIVGAPTPG